MKNLSLFQLAILGLFLIFILVGVLIFAGVLPGYRQTSTSEAVALAIWGTTPAAVLEPFFAKLNNDYQERFILSYTEKAAATFARDFVEAKADGRAPDLLLLPSELGQAQRDRLVVWPASVMPLRQYRDTFVDAGELYLSEAGTTALPLVIDPLVLYYNKTLLNDLGLAAVPRTWTEFIDQTARLTILDDRRNVLQSAIALGETRNILHAKDILALLFLQAGNPIVSNVNGRAVSRLNENLGFPLKPAVAVLNFYTQFSDSGLANYGWNRSLPEARTAFLRGQLAFYLGYASEYQGLKRENPHLQFDVALPPQTDNTGKVTLGRVFGLAAVAGGAKVNAALGAAVVLAGREANQLLAQTLFLPPARRDLLAAGQADPTLAVFYPAAVVSRAWPDPDPDASKQIFATMIESVVTGRQNSAEAVAEANTALGALLVQKNGE
ncbi:MAG: extracellular solute-binding protein [Patescibacteria group bacterium]